jgi:hypothetical protein
MNFSNLVSSMSLTTALALLGAVVLWLLLYTAGTRCTGCARARP